MNIKISNAILVYKDYTEYDFSELTQGAIQDATPSAIASSTNVYYTYPFVQVSDNKLKIHADNIVLNGVTYTPRLRLVMFETADMTSGRLSGTKNTLVTNWISAWGGWAEGAFDSEGNAEPQFADSVKYVRFTLAYIETGGTSNALSIDAGLDAFKNTFIYTK